MWNRYITWVPLLLLLLCTVRLLLCYRWAPPTAQQFNVLVTLLYISLYIYFTYPACSKYYIISVSGSVFPYLPPPHLHEKLCTKMQPKCDRSPLPIVSVALCVCAFFPYASIFIRWLFLNCRSIGINLGAGHKGAQDSVVKIVLVLVIAPLPGMDTFISIRNYFLEHILKYVCNAYISVGRGFSLPILRGAFGIARIV